MICYNPITCGWWLWMTSGWYIWYICSMILYAIYCMFYVWHILWFMTYTWWNPSDQPPCMVNIPKLVGGLEHEWIIFPFSWECHHPNWRTPSFFRGVGIPPTSYVFYSHNINDFPIWHPSKLTSHYHLPIMSHDFPHYPHLPHDYPHA